VGVALATALLPRLSALHRGGDAPGADGLLGGAMVFAAFLGFPAAAGLIVIAPEIIGGLFQYGAFGAADAAMSAAALGAYALGLPAHVMARLLQTSFYAQGRPGFVLGASIATVAVNVALSLALMPLLGHVGLALATSASGFAGLAICSAGLLREGRFPALPWWLLCRILLCACAMAAVLVAIDGVGDGLLAPVRLAALVAAGGAVYFAAAWLMRALPGRPGAATADKAA